MFFLKNKNKGELEEIDIVKQRLLLVGSITAIIFILIALRIFNLMILNGDYYNQIVLSKKQASHNSKVIYSKRGDIFDSDNNLLATSIKVYNLILDPKVINSYSDNRYVDATIDALVEVYDYNKLELRGLIEEKKDKAYIRYERQMSEEDKNKFELYKKEKNENYKKNGSVERINGVWFEEEYKRYYPYDFLASNVIGFVNEAGDSVMGLELYYDTELSGVDGRKYGYVGDGYKLHSVDREVEDGYNLITTINYEYQKICEEHLAIWQNGEIGSKSASVLVMNPNNGEVLAMASTNNFDLNNPRDVSNLDEMYVEEVGIENIWYSRWKNNIVQDTFEPGSTSKVMTLASAIDENLVGADTKFDCKGYIELDDGENKWRIRCNNRNGHGDLNLVESLSNSCNMSMAEMGEMLGIKQFSKYQKTFGFGNYTKIDLPNEADTSNLVYNEETMGRTDLATNSFGQNFNCTMIQMATAFNSCINGGYYYKPHLVKKIESRDKTFVKEYKEEVVRKTISEPTSKFIREALFETVERGTGKYAQIRNKNIGGKTGTAEKLPRSDKNYLVSFIGFDDKDNPNLTIYVVIDNPNLEGEAQANANFATTIFHDIMKDIISLEE